MPSLPSYEITQGDTGPIWSVGFDDERSLTGYTCKVAVSGTAIARTVTTKNVGGTRFLVQLTPTETSALGKHIYTAGIEVANSSSTPPFVKETQFLLDVCAQVVTA